MVNVVWPTQPAEPVTVTDEPPIVSFLVEAETALNDVIVTANPLRSNVPAVKFTTPKVVAACNNQLPVPVNDTTPESVLPASVSALSVPVDAKLIGQLIVVIADTRVTPPQMDNV